MTIEEGVLILNPINGLGWRKMSDGQINRSDWVNIDKADIYPAKFVQDPTDVTYNGSPHWEELEKGRVVCVKRTIDTIIIL